MTGRRYDQIRIVTDPETLKSGLRLDLPLGLDVLNTAEKAKPEPEQISFDTPIPPRPAKAPLS